MRPGIIAYNSPGKSNPFSLYKHLSGPLAVWYQCHANFNLCVCLFQVHEVSVSVIIGTTQDTLPVMRRRKKGIGCRDTKASATQVWSWSERDISPKIPSSRSCNHVVTHPIAILVIHLCWLPPQFRVISRVDECWNLELILKPATRRPFIWGLRSWETHFYIA